MTLTEKVINAVNAVNSYIYYFIISVPYLFFLSLLIEPHFYEFISSSCNCTVVVANSNALFQFGHYTLSPKKKCNFIVLLCSFSLFFVLLRFLIIYYNQNKCG